MDSSWTVYQRLDWSIVIWVDLSFGCGCLDWVSMLVGIFVFSGDGWYFGYQF